MADWYVTDHQTLNDGGTHSYNTVYVYDDSVSGEVLATGDGTTTSFSGNLANNALHSSSLTVHYTIGGTGYDATDDGNGNISGTDCTGTIDYDTGAYTLDFSTAPDNGTDITADYTSDGRLEITNGTILQCDKLHVGSNDGSAYGLGAELVVRDTSQIVFNDVSDCGFYGGQEATIDIQGTDSSNRVTIKGGGEPPTNYPFIGLGYFSDIGGGTITVKNTDFRYVQVVRIGSNTNVGRYNGGFELEGVGIYNTSGSGLYFYYFSNTDYYSDGTGANWSYDNAIYKLRNITISNTGSAGLVFYTVRFACGLWLEDFSISGASTNSVNVGYGAIVSLMGIAGEWNINHTSSSYPAISFYQNYNLALYKSDMSRRKPYLNISNTGGDDDLRVGNSTPTRFCFPSNAENIGFTTAYYNGIGPVLWEKLEVTSNVDCGVVTVSQEDDDEEFQYSSSVTAGVQERIYAAKAYYNGTTKIYLTGDGGTYKKTKVYIIPPSGYTIKQALLDDTKITVGDDNSIEVDMTTSHSLDLTFQEEAVTSSSRSLKFPYVRGLDGLR